MQVIDQYVYGEFCNVMVEIQFGNVFVDVMYVVEGIYGEQDICEDEDIDVVVLGVLFEMEQYVNYQGKQQIGSEFGIDGLGWNVLGQLIEVVLVLYYGQYGYKIWQCELFCVGQCVFGQLVCQWNVQVGQCYYQIKWIDVSQLFDQKFDYCCSVQCGQQMCVVQVDDEVIEYEKEID